MATIVSFLAIVALVIGGLLGTFRHRAYGVWSLAGILIAMTTANIIGTSVGTWMATTIGTPDINPVLVMVKVVMLVVVSLIISYYASDLLPFQADPKTRFDNITSGTLGVFNAYLVVATIFLYVQAINNDTVKNIFGDGGSFNFNRMFIDGLPWITSVLVLYIIGWSSVIKFKQAWAKLRGTSTPSSASNSTTTTMNIGNPYPSQPGSYGSPSSYAQTPTGGASTQSGTSQDEKKGFFAGLKDWFRRDDKASDSSQNGSSSTIMSQTAPGYPAQSPTYQNTSGATPPYGIATGGVNNPGYSSAPTTGGFNSPSAGYNPTYGTSSYGNTNQSSTYSPMSSSPAVSTPNYSTSPSYPPTTPSSSFGTYGSTSPTSVPTTPSSSFGSYGSTPTTSSPMSSNFTPGYGNTPAPSTPSSGYGYSSGGSGSYNPSTPSNNDSSIGGAAIGGAAIGGLFGATFAGQASSGFGDGSAYHDSDDGDEYYDGEDDEDSDNPQYPSDYR